MEGMSIVAFLLGAVARNLEIFQQAQRTPKRQLGVTPRLLS